MLLRSPSIELHRVLRVSTTLRYRGGAARPLRGDGGNYCLAWAIIEFSGLYLCEYYQAVWSGTLRTGKRLPPRILPRPLSGEEHGPPQPPGDKLLVRGAFGLRRSKTLVIPVCLSPRPRRCFGAPAEDGLGTVQLRPSAAFLAELPSRQTTLAISTTKAEYVAAGRACQQALWMNQVIKDYDIHCEDVFVLCNYKGSIDLCKNPVHHSRTKHIEIRHHSLRDNVQKGNILKEKVASEDNIADILTKPLKRETFNYLRLGLC
ncbi:hypothetical protein Tco_0935665 [Tanacetum coccineum]